MTQKALYDQLGIFNIGLTNSQKSFNIYGNYYSIYSYNLPCVAPKNVGNNLDDFSSTSLFKIKLYHSTFPDEYVDAHPDEIMYNQLPHYTTLDGSKMPFADFTVNIIDLATRDNDPVSNDQTASERHMRGLICYKVGENVTNITNVNVEAFMISLCVEHANSTLNLDKVNFYNAWQNHLFLWNDNRYQAWVQGKDFETGAYVHNLKVNINDSDLTKCGGPVILAQHKNTDRLCNLKNGVEVNVTGTSDLHTYVTGQEAWFVAVGQTQLAAQIRAMSSLIGVVQGQPVITGHGYAAKDKIQGVETINMVMVNMGVGLNVGGTETYNASYTENGITSLLSGKQGNERFQNSELDNYKYATSLENNGVPAPIFQSSGGGTALTDGATGCYGIDFGTQQKGMPSATLYQGEYITLYYMGIGIMLEYYHK